MTTHSNEPRYDYRSDQVGAAARTWVARGGKNIDEITLTDEAIARVSKMLFGSPGPPAPSPKRGRSRRSHTDQTTEVDKPKAGEAPPNL